MTPLLNEVSRWDYDVIASIATGGIAHGIAIAREFYEPHVSVKTAEKDHGLGGLVDGDVGILKGAYILLVEDMSSTFESSLKAMRALEEHGARVVRTLLLNTWYLPDFQRNVEEHEVWALATGEMLLDYAVKDRRLDEEHERIVRHWLVHPEDESWAHDGRWGLA